MKGRIPFTNLGRLPGAYLLFAIAISLFEPVLGQIAPNFNQRDDTYPLLGLKRAKEAYETARSDFARSKELHDKNLISSVEFEQAKNLLANAEVNYHQSLLAVLFEKQYVSVSRAVKYHAPDGSRHVRLTIDNTSGGTAEFQKLLNIEDELFKSLQPNIINNVYISLLNDNQTIISQPYEAKIDVLRWGKPESIDFKLLEDLDAVTVSIIYGNGTQRIMKIFLQKDATVDKVAVRSEQFSQEIELGKNATFDLSLELFSGANKTYSFLALNLPEQIGRFFKDPAGNARLSSVKFSESSHTKKAALEISLPERPTEDVVMDNPIAFFVVVTPRDLLEKFSNPGEDNWSEEDLKKLDVGYVRLEMIPRGKGRLLVRTPQLYHSIKSDETARMYLEIVNEGSHRLDNIEINTDLPFNWRKNLSSEVISSLDIGEETRVELEFYPPSDVAVGKYDIRLEISAVSNNQPVLSEDKTLTVEIQASANIFGTALLTLLIVGLVGGIVVFGVRLSKK